MHERLKNASFCPERTENNKDKLNFTIVYNNVLVIHLLHLFVRNKVYTSTKENKKMIIKEIFYYIISISFSMRVELFHCIRSLKIHCCFFYYKFFQQQ